MFVIYKISNILNYKVYIGVTKKSILKRLSEHVYNAFNDKTKRNIKFYRAIRKYGADAFYIQQIDSCCQLKESYEKEKHYIKYYNSQKDGYNTTGGGDGAFNVSWSEETRLIWSNQRKGRRLSSNHKKKLSDAKIGKVTWMKNNRNARKLSDDDYLYIKTNANIKSQKQIAKELGVHQSTISKLLKLWKK